MPIGMAPSLRSGGLVLYHVEGLLSGVRLSVAVGHLDGQDVLAGLEAGELDGAADPEGRGGGPLVELEAQCRAAAAEELLEESLPRPTIPHHHLGRVLPARLEPAQLVVELEHVAPLVGAERI